MKKSGILLIDKPKGPTSHDIVSKVRKHFKCKVGHAGTLDPLATGVLVLLINDATKLSSFLSLEDKEYVVDFVLGIKTDTLDADGKVTHQFEVPKDLNENKINDLLAEFQGKQQQYPPMFSAVKQNGKKLYQIAREGDIVDRKPRQIEIYDLELLSWDNPVVSVRIKCSKGTYVRQFVSDFGDKLGCGAFVKDLRRISSGNFRIDQTYTSEQIFGVQNLSDLDIISLSDALSFMSSYVCPEENIYKILNGQKTKIDKKSFLAKNTKKIRVLTPKGQLLAIANIDNEELQPIRVFHNEFINYFDTLQL